MKSLKTLTLFCFIIAVQNLWPQHNGFNYKAIIKDNLGNVVSNQAINVRFQILENNTLLYEEIHSSTTGNNGLVILTIGFGSPIQGNFSTINWSSLNHNLNVKIDIGNGLVDMGTTAFQSVPYASNVRGLEAIDEGNGIGWRLVDRNANLYGNLGREAIDLSYNNSPSTTSGATGVNSITMGQGTTASNNLTTAIGSFTTASGVGATAIGSSTTASGTVSTAMGQGTVASGIYSIASGFNTTASGGFSIAMGSNTEASASNSTAMGNNTTASGRNATSAGFNTNAISFSETSIGTYNTTYIPNSTSQFNSNDRLLVIGNGQDDANRSDALIILKNGTVIAPSFDSSEITDAKALITKEYLESNTSNSSGLEAIDEGNGIGWRLVGRNPLNYGNIGSNAVDVSFSIIDSETRGATGNWSFAANSSTTASGNKSFATGAQTIASGDTSFAAGVTTIASGSRSTAFGSVTTASGINSSAFGSETKAESVNSFAIGSFNIGGGHPQSVIETDPLFEIGNGTSDANRSNALTVLKNGTITAPSFDISEITDAKALITKEYAETNIASSGLEAIDEGNGIGYRLKNSNPDFFGNVGENATDLSTSDGTDGSQGAIGFASASFNWMTTASGFGASTFGNLTNASGALSFAAGFSSIASGESSFAIGNSEASGTYSLAANRNTLASGENSFAANRQTSAIGENSSAFGRLTRAESLNSFAIGYYNIGGGDPLNPVSTDPLFEIGNGDDNNRSNALTVYKSGVVNINDAFSLPNTDGLSGQTLITNGNGSVRWTTMSIEPGTIIDVTTFGTNYGPLGGNVYEEPRYYIENNRVYIEGTIQKSSGTPIAGDLLFTLPVGYRPAKQRIFTGTQDGNTTVRVDVRANGSVVVLSSSTLNFIALDGITFRID